MNIGNDFFEYDPAVDSWTRKASFPGTGRQFAVGFSIGKKGYIGTGFDLYGVTRDFYEYDPAANSWMRRKDLPGIPRLRATGFSTPTRGYIGTGQDSDAHAMSDFYEYDPASNKWTGRAAVPQARSGAMGFAIGFQAFIGTGWNNFELTDFYEYKPLGIAAGVAAAAGNDDLNFYPNPATGSIILNYLQPAKVSIMSMDGRLMYAADATREVNIKSLPDGEYLLITADSKGQRLKTGRFTKRE